MDQGLEEYVPPASPLWAPFSKAVTKKTLEWDILRRAVDEAWSNAFHPKYCEQRIVNDLLINFAEAWKNNSNVKASAISDFFTFFFNDFFEAEIDGSGYPLAMVLSRVFSEVRSGRTTGLEHILGPNWHKTDEQIAEENRQANALAAMMNQGMNITRTSESANQAIKPTSDAQMVQNDEAVNTETGAKPDETAAADDGWTVAGGGRRGRRNRNRNQGSEVRRVLK